MKRLIQELYQQCIHQIDYDINFGYKDMSDLQFQLIKHYYQLQCEVKDISFLKPNMIYLALKTQIILTLLIKNRNKIEQQVLLVTPCEDQIYSALENISDKLLLISQVQLKQSVRKQDNQIQNIRFLIISSHNLCASKWTIKQIQQLLEFCQNHKIIVISLESQYDMFLRQYHSLLQFSCDFDNLVIINRFGREFQDQIDFQNSLAIIRNKQIRQLYVQNTYAYKIIPSETGLLLLRGFLGEKGQHLRHKLRKRLQQNYEKVITTLKQSININMNKVVLIGFKLIIEIDNGFIVSRTDNNNDTITIVNTSSNQHKISVNLLRQTEQIEHWMVQLIKNSTKIYPKL